MEASIVTKKLTQQNKAFYKAYGYLIVPNIINQQEINELKKETLSIVKRERGHVEGLIDDVDYLSDKELLKKYSAIHFPHKISPLIKAHAANKKIAAILSGLISPNMKCLQTMLFMKGPGKKGQSWHQDEYFIPTRDQSLVGVWMALDDAKQDNGCLWVIPGSHKEGFIRRRIENNNQEFADVDVADIGNYTPDDFVKAEVTKGSAIIFHGYLLHMSLQNKTTDSFRRALVSHYSSAESMLPWNFDGNSNHIIDFRDIFMVSGKDPYAYKGLQDLTKPVVRPDVLDFNDDYLKISGK